MSQHLRSLIDQIFPLMEQLRAEIDTVVPPVQPPADNVIRVRPGDDVAKAAQTLEQTGGTILMQPGRYKVALEPRERAGNKLITFKTDTDNLPADGKRITPEYAPGLAMFESIDGITPVLWADVRTGGYAFVGVGSLPMAMNDRTVFEIGGDRHRLKTVADRPRGFLFDRFLALGDPQRGQHRWIMANGVDGRVRGCWAADFHEAHRDSQVICGWNGTQNWLLENSHLEGSAENVLWGGADSASPEMAPQDIQMIGLRITKPLAWKQTQASIKCLFEVKHVRRLSVRGCLFEQCWARDWPFGVAIVLKCANQDGTEHWNICEDVMIEDCVVRNVGQVMAFVAQNDAQQPTQRMRNITLRNILAYNLNTGPWTGTGRGLMSANLPNGLSVDHVSFIGNQNHWFYFWWDVPAAERRASGLNWTNSVMSQGAYGLHSPSGLGVTALNQAYPDGYKVTSNVIERHHERVVNMPPGNPLVEPAAFTASFDAQKRVRAGSTVATAVQTTDGKPIGADVDSILQRLADPIF